MAKMKTHSSLKGRFKITGTGKVLRYRSGRNHLLEKKSKRRKRNLSTNPVMSAGDVKRLKQHLSNLK